MFLIIVDKEDGDFCEYPANTLEQAEEIFEREVKKNPMYCEIVNEETEEVLGNYPANF